MKLCFFTIWREDSDTVGINMKIQNQVKAFSNLGCDAYFCVSSSSFVSLYHFIADTKTFLLVHKKKFTKAANHANKNGKIAEKLSSFFRLNECLHFMNEMQTVYMFDIIYIRRIQPFTTNIKKYLIKWNSLGAKIFWEIPTGGEKPITVIHKLIKIQEDYQYRQLNDKMKIVSVSSVQDGLEGYVFINNGVDNSTIPVKRTISHRGYRIICLATFNYWHGYDRLLNGLAEYNQINNGSEIEIYMVGNGEIDDLKKQAENLCIANHVHFLGIKTGDELDGIFDEMDIAVGNLGFFRKGVTSDTSIKIREYCARGIPFVTALSVNDFPNDFPYVLKVPMDESYIDISSLIQFINNLDLEKTAIDMRIFSENNLTWEKQLLKVLETI